MRNAFLLSLFIAAGIAGSRHVAAVEEAAPQATSKPAQPAGGRATQGRGAQPAGRGTAQAARGSIALRVTTPAGDTLEGVRVELIGPSPRVNDTNATGQVTFGDLQVGTYLLRLSHDSVTSFEKEVELAAGRAVTVDVPLNPAPPPVEVFKEAPAPPPAPRGESRSLLITELLEKEFVGREARRETLLSCSGELRTTMLQLNQPLPDRLYDAADVTSYVLGGEGTITMNGQDTQIRTNGFVSVPRGTVHAFSRRGNRPLVLLAMLGGEPCEEAR
jgi:hypothetical protein